MLTQTIPISTDPCTLTNTSQTKLQKIHTAPQSEKSGNLELGCPGRHKAWSEICRKLPFLKEIT